MKNVELLAPAGDLLKLKLAIKYGADAVFIGGEEYGLRSGTGNFTMSDIKEGVIYAKKYNAKVYITTNIFAHDENYVGFKKFVKEIDELGVTGIIVSDPGYIKIAQKYTDLEIHISTQQSITNSRSVNFFEQLGADRVVLARELNSKEIEKISKNTKAEIEIFIHGAVCSSYSGRCTLSNHMTLRDSNRGGCCQSCRWNYELGELNEDKFKSTSDENLFNMSVKDMSLLESIPELMNLGVDSFKIEGRMKSYHYVTTVVKIYREAIDSYMEDPKKYKVKQYWIDELKKAESRSSAAGSFVSNMSNENQIFGSQYQDKEYDYCGIVLNYDNQSKIVEIEQRNFFKIGDTIEFMGPDIKTFEYKVTNIKNELNEEIEKANHPLMKVKLKVDKKLEKDYIVRIKKEKRG